MERLFVIIGRVNSALFLLLLLGCAGALVWMAIESSSWQRRGTIEVTKADSDGTKKILLNLGQLENITGADTQMIRLEAHEESGKFSSGYSSETRNALFLKSSDKAARWLFKDHTNVILTMAQLREDSNDSKELPTKALYFEFVAKDSNQDGRVSSGDHSSIGLALPDGSGFQEVLHDVARVFSYSLIDENQLSVVYQKGSAVRLAKFALTTKKLTSDQELITVPNTL